MHIHIGNRIAVSDSSILGIFNVVTLKKSELNTKYLKNISENSKAVILMVSNDIITSSISPFTIIKRNSGDGTFVWRKNNDQ